MPNRGGAALVSKDLNEKSKDTSKKSMKSKHCEAAGATDAAKGSYLKNFNVEDLRSDQETRH